MRAEDNHGLSFNIRFTIYDFLNDIFVRVFSVALAYGFYGNLFEG